MAKKSTGKIVNVRLLAARRRALAKLAAPDAGSCDGLVFGKTIAARILGVSPKALDKIVAPVDKAKNPHYRTGPEVSLYDPCDLLEAKKKRAYGEAVAKRANVKAKDWPAFMAARYGSPEAAIPDAAQALFNLNRYTRHRTCSEPHRDEILQLKARFIRMVYLRQKYTDRVEKLVRAVPEQACSCEGLQPNCEKCGETGVFREEQTVATYVFYFTIGDRTYCWMQRRDELDFSVQVDETKPDDGHRGRDQTLNIPRKKLAEAKAIVAFAIGHEKMTKPPWCGGAAGGAANDSANGSRDEIAPGRPPEHSATERHAPPGAAPLIVDLLSGSPHVTLGVTANSRRPPDHTIGKREGNIRHAASGRSKGNSVVPNRRLSFDEKIALARQIAEVAVALVIREGVTEHFDQTGGTMRNLTYGRFRMTYITPEALVFGGPAPYGIDIWDPMRKVFSAWWEPFEVVSFRRGDWIYELVPNAPSLREDASATGENGRRGPSDA